MRQVVSPSPAAPCRCSTCLPSIDQTEILVRTTAGVISWVFRRGGAESSSSLVDADAPIASGGWASRQVGALPARTGLWDGFVRSKRSRGRCVAAWSARTNPLGAPLVGTEPAAPSSLVTPGSLLDIERVFV